MKRSPLNRIGKIGVANLEANRKIAMIWKERGYWLCEIRFDGCKRDVFLTPAHRHKRIWYKGDAEKLADPRQWIVACVSCHDKIEHNKELTESIFLKLRGKE